VLLVYSQMVRPASRSMAPVMNSIVIFLFFSRIVILWLGSLTP
jgi:hypothetical protein